MAYQTVDEDRGTGQASTCFIGSILDGPGHGLIVLRGELGRAAVERLGEHLDAFFDGPTRYLMLDARDVDCYHPDLLNLLGHTQRRLAGRRGMLQVRGLQSTRMAETIPGPPEAAVPTPAPDPDTGPRGRGRGDGPGRWHPAGRHRRAGPTDGGRPARPLGPHSAAAEHETPGAEADRTGMSPTPADALAPHRLDWAVSSGPPPAGARRWAAGDGADSAPRPSA